MPTLTEIRDEMFAAFLRKRGVFPKHECMSEAISRKLSPEELNAVSFIMKSTDAGPAAPHPWGAENLDSNPSGTRSLPPVALPPLPPTSRSLFDLAPGLGDVGDVSLDLSGFCTESLSGVECHEDEFVPFRYYAKILQYS